FRRTKNAGFRVRRKAAEESEQSPPTGFSGVVENQVARKHGHKREADYGVETEFAIGRNSTSRQNGKGRRNGQANCFAKTNGCQQQVSMTGDERKKIVHW